jgi:hypothetical protein
MVAAVTPGLFDMESAAGEKMRVGVGISKLKVMASFFNSLLSFPRLFLPMTRLIQFVSYFNFIPEYFWVVFQT